MQEMWQLLDTKKCRNCNNVYNGQGHKVNGITWCKPCHEEYEKYHFFECAVCSTKCEDDYKNRVGEDKVCSDCFAEEAYCCYNCSDGVWKKDAVQHRSNTWACTRCASKFFQCGVCDKFKGNDNRSSLSRPYKMCVSCADKRHDGFLETPDYDRVKICPTATVVGLELECCDNAPRDRRLNKWGRSSDGSVQGKSPTEFISVPLREHEFHQAVFDFNAWCQDNAINVDKSCGFHVHYNVHAKDITLRFLKNVLIMYSKVQDFFFRTQPASRDNNKYCRRLDFDLDRIMKTERMHELVGLYYAQTFDRNWLTQLPKGKYSEKRYYWINLHSIMSHQTIEVRLHAGTTNVEKITKWVESHRKLLKWALTAKPEEAMQMNEKKMAQILGEDNMKYLTRRISEFEQARVEEERARIEKQLIERRQTEEARLSREFPREQVMEMLAEVIDQTLTFHAEPAEEQEE